MLPATRGDPMTWDWLPHLCRLELAVLFPILVVSSVRAWRTEPIWASPLRRWVLAATCAHAALALALVPFAAWRANRHGYEWLPSQGLHRLEVVGLENVHGSAGAAVDGLIMSLSLQTLDLPWVHFLYALAAIPMTAVWWARLRGSELEGVGAAWVLALMPAWLRLGPTDDTYVLTTLALLGAWVEVERHLTSGARSDLLRGLGWTLFAVQSRLDMLAIVPVALVLTLLARDRARLVSLWTEAPLRGALGLFLLAMLPRFAVLAWGALGAPWSWIYEVSNSGGTDSVIASALRLLPPLVLLGLGSLVARRLPPSLPLGWLGGAVLLACAAAPGVAPDRWTGVEPRSLEAWASFGMAHALFDPLYTPLGWTALLAATLIGWTVYQPRLAAHAGVWIVLQVWVLSTQYDAPSTHLRTALPLAPWVAGLVATGAVAWWRSLRLPRAAAAAVLVACVVLPVGRYASWLGYRFPMQQESELLLSVPDLLAPGDTLHLLQPIDYPQQDLKQRAIVKQGAEPAGLLRATGAFGRQPLPGLTTLATMPWPPSSSGRTLYLRTLDCNTARSGNRVDPTTGEPGTTLWVGGRTLFLSRDEAHQRARGLATYDRKQLQPQIRRCLADPSLLRCHQPAPEGGCALWRCEVEPVEPPPPLQYSDPLCAAIEDRFELTPLIEVRLNPGNAGGALLEVVGDAPYIGLYVVEGLRSP
jgi:hypothetical protein